MTTNSTDRDFKIGDIISHFKRELIEGDKGLKHLYVIVEFAMHTENEEQLVIYKSLDNGKVYARPYGMFISEVDHEKYPEIKQKYRLEKCVLDSNIHILEDSLTKILLSRFNDDDIEYTVDKNYRVKSVTINL